MFNLAVSMSGAALSPGSAPDSSSTPMQSGWGSSDGSRTGSLSLEWKTQFEFLAGSSRVSLALTEPSGY